jgi:hypothetical protein
MAFTATNDPSPAPRDGEREGIAAQHEGFYAAFTSRNAGLIPPDEQRRLRHAHVLVAGCGSIGGAAVEPLVRLGVEHLRLAEPDTYDLPNLNRQSARVQDIGRNKAVVLQERMHEINSYASIEVEEHGITPENVETLVEWADVIIDGVDVTTRAALHQKFALHAHASRRRVPVVLGLDIAGVQLVRVFDYRRPGQQLLDGRVGRDELEASEPFEFMERMVPALAIPLEMLAPLRLLLLGEAQAFPQIVYAAQLFGVLAPRIILDLVAGRPVRSSIRLDVHNVVRPLPERVRVQSVRLWRMYWLAREFKRLGRIGRRH